MPRKCTNEYRFCGTCGRIFLAFGHNIRNGWGKYCSHGCRSKNPKTIAKMTKTMRNRDWSSFKPMPQTYKKGSVPWNKGIINCWSEEILTKIKDARAKQVFLNTDTSIELIMKAALDGADIIYEHPFIFHKYYNIDFAIPELRIAIECDGDYFHSLPRNQRFDIRKQLFLTKHRWSWVRFSESLIKSNIEKCVEFIKIMIINNKKMGVVV